MICSMQKILFFFLSILSSNEIGLVSLFDSCTRTSLDANRRIPKSCSSIPRKRGYVQDTTCNPSVEPINPDGDAN